MNNDVGHFIVSTEKSFAACSNNCHKDHRCIAFSYDESKNKCVIPHNEGLNQSFDSNRLGLLELSGENNYWNISALFERHCPMSFDSSSNSTCVVLDNRIWKMAEDQCNNSNQIKFYWHEECNFTSKIISEIDKCWSTELCGKKCVENSACSHFSYRRWGQKCFLMSALELMDLSNTTDDKSNCGYIPNRIWRHYSNKGEGNLIIVKSNCVFPSSDDDGQQE